MYLLSFLLGNGRNGEARVLEHAQHPRSSFWKAEGSTRVIIIILIVIDWKGTKMKIKGFDHFLCLLLKSLVICLINTSDEAKPLHPWSAISYNCKAKQHYLKGLLPLHRFVFMFVFCKKKKQTNNSQLALLPCTHRLQGRKDTYHHPSHIPCRSILWYVWCAMRPFIYFFFFT